MTRITFPDEQLLNDAIRKMNEQNTRESFVWAN